MPDGTPIVGGVLRIGGEVIKPAEDKESLYQYSGGITYGYTFKSLILYNSDNQNDITWIKCSYENKTILVADRPLCNYFPVAAIYDHRLLGQGYDVTLDGVKFKARCPSKEDWDGFVSASGGSDAKMHWSWGFTRGNSVSGKDGDNYGTVFGYSSASFYYTSRGGGASILDCFRPVLELVE